MTITREQVADLQPGDVVEYRRDDWPDGAFVRSPLNAADLDAALYVLDGQFGVRTHDGRPYEHMATLTVVSRAPRPLYVNHPRTEPVAGDVVRDADNESRTTVWMMDFGVDTEGVWCPPTGVDSFSRAELPARLRLLVDGETGQVVQ